MSQRAWIHSISRSISSRIRRGVSLIELLVGIGIVLAIAAIVIPWTAGWLGGRELDNAEDGLAMQMVMARAAAREEGRPVEVIAESDGTGSRIKARWMARGEDAGRSGSGYDSGYESGGPRSSARTDSGVETSINANWASMRLPQGVRIALGMEPALGTSRSPGIEADDSEAVRSGADAFETDGFETGALGARGQTLAIFLPDGTVFFAPVFMLRTDAGSARTMQVNRANGVPQQVEPAAADADAADLDSSDLDSSDLDSGDLDPLP